MDAGLLDVLHDRADHGGFAVGNAIDVHFGGVVEEAVDEHRALGRGDDGLAHVAGELGVAIDDHHAAAAEHEGRADEHRIADAVGDDDGFRFVGGGAGFGLFEIQLVEQGGEKFPVFGLFDGFRRGADDRDAVAFEVGGEVERGLAAELDDDAEGFFLVADVEHVFERERLEEEFVGGVVVGGDGLGVRVHHDGFVAEFLQREGGVDAAVVELDALADAVRAAAEDDDFLFVRLAGFVFVAVGGVEIRRVGLELGGAGVDEAVAGDDAFRFALGADGVLGRDVDHRGFRFGAWRGTGGLVGFAVDGNVVDRRRGGAGHGDLAVGETEFFRALEIERGEVHAFVRDLLEMAEEPRVDLGGVENLLKRPAVHEGGLQPENALGVRDLELAGDLVAGRRVRILFVEAEAPTAGFERAQAFLHGLLEGAADRHRLADGFHRGGENRIRSREFLEGETRDFRDHVVDGRLERSRRDAGDVVRQLVERVADGELRGDLGDREIRWLSRRARSCGKPADSFR